jgi:hypothetical protein
MVKLNPRSIPTGRQTPGAKKPGPKSPVYLSSKRGPVVARDAADVSDPDSPNYDPASDESMDDSEK